MCHLRMRTLTLPFAAMLAAAACSSDASSSSGPGTQGNPSSTTYNVAADSANAERTIVAGSSTPVIVTVSLDGKPAPGIVVSWKANAGSGTVADSLSVADSAGLARTTWTINDTAKVNTLTAAVGTSSATLHATGVAGPPSALVRVSPDSIPVVAGASALLTVRVTDRKGNGVSGAVVHWSAAAGTLDVAASASGSSGAAEATFTAPAAPGTYFVTAAIDGIGSVVFRVVGL